MTGSVARRVRVYFPCTGLGREARGFEAFTRECAAALRDTEGLALTVFGGGDDLEEGERHVRSLSRRGAAAALLGALLRHDPYFVEQATFAASFVPALLVGDPDVVYFADIGLGNAMWHWRRLSGQRYRLLFYNGGPTTKPFTRCDLVQQVSPEHLTSALTRGERPERQALLPHGVSIPAEFHEATPGERAGTRLALGVPADGSLLLSVGALNASHKRMDFVIRETAALPSPRPHLLLLGAETGETPALRALAADKLGIGGCTLRTVTRQMVTAAYRAADAFVLASTMEGFGLAYVEALAAGLPCVVHDSPTTAYIFGVLARRADLRWPGTLTPLLAAALADGARPRADDAARRHAWARAHFSWDHLVPQYAELLRACAARRVPNLVSV